MMYFLDKSRQEKAIAVATRLDKNMRDKNVKVKKYGLERQVYGTLNNAYLTV